MSLFPNLDCPALEVTDWFFCLSGNLLLHKNPSVQREETIVEPDHGYFFSSYDFQLQSFFSWTYFVNLNALHMFLAVTVIDSDYVNNAVSSVETAFLVELEIDLSCAEIFYHSILLLLSPSNHS